MHTMGGGGTKIKPQTGFVQHLITDKIPGITNILAEDIDQDGDMDIITTEKEELVFYNTMVFSLLKAKD